MNNIILNKYYYVEQILKQSAQSLSFIMYVEGLYPGTLLLLDSFKTKANQRQCLKKRKEKRIISKKNLTACVC